MRSHGERRDRHVRRPPHLRLCRLLPALVSPRFPPLLPLLPILLPLVLPLGCCILILLRSPSDQCTSERARSAKIIADETVAVLATAAKVDNLDHARCW